METTSSPAQAATETAGEEDAQITPINVIARRRRRRRMLAALILVIVGVATFKCVGAGSNDNALTPTQPTVSGPARTPQEALQKLRGGTADDSVSNKLTAGVMAAQNFHTAMGTYDGFVFPGATVVSGSKGAVLIVQDAGTCYTRTLTDTTSTEVTNDPTSCTTAGQLELEKALS